MRSKILKSFSKLEKQKLEMLYSFNAIKQENKTLQKDGKWSPIQIIAHVIEVEKVATDSILWRINEKGFNKKPTITDKIKAILMKLLLRSKIKFKAPKNLSDVPNYFTAGELNDNWKFERLRLKKIIEETKDENLSKVVFKHPRGIKMNLNMYSKFVYEHIDHHHKQLKTFL